MSQMLVAVPFFYVVVMTDTRSRRLVAQEFHRAMPALGLNVPKEGIDELFSAWDKDGGGAIDYKELKKILTARPGSSPTKEVKKTANAAVAMTRMGNIFKAPAPAPPPPVEVQEGNS